jgi:single-stranded-DNA-specific exonuclease
MQEMSFELRGNAQPGTHHYPGLNAGPLVQAVLQSRGIDREKAEELLLVQQPKLINPFAIFGMSAAVARINEALLNKEQIVVIGDYDVDGITATEIMVDYLRTHRGATVSDIIPHRIRDGYGVTEGVAERAYTTGAKLAITVDCGIANADVIDKWGKKMDFVVTDHHQFQRDAKGCRALCAS